MAFTVTLLVVRVLGFNFAVWWTMDQFAWWKLIVVGLGAVLVGMQIRNVRRQAARDQALTEARRRDRLRL